MDWKQQIGVLKPLVLALGRELMDSDSRVHSVYLGSSDSGGAAIHVTCEGGEVGVEQALGARKAKHDALADVPLIVHAGEAPRILLAPAGGAG